MSFLIKKTPFLLLLLGYFTVLYAQKPLRIEGKIRNFKPTQLVLKQHFAGILIPIDTVQADVNGRFVFEDLAGIPAGMCRIVSISETSTPGFRGIDLVVADSPQCSFEADLADVVGTIRFNNSQENTLFYQYQREVRKRYQPLLAFRQQAAINNDKDPRWQVRFQEFNQTIKNYVDSLYRQYPQSLTTRFLKSYQEPRKPILPVKQLSAKDSAYIRSYVREHFFENSSLADERMIYTPTIPARLERWMKSISKLPKEDLIKLYARAIDQTQGTVELRKHFIGQIAQSLELTPDPNLDEVYTFIIKNYVEKDPSLWDASTLQKIKEVYEIKQKLAIGNVFPELALTDMAENPRPLSSVSAENTLLFFYDPGCSHCRDSAPKLVEYLQKNPTKLTVYAVSLDPDEGQWKTFIKEMKTDNFINVHDKTRQTEFYKLGVFTYPTLYLLDRDKKIVKRWLNTEQLEQILP